MLRCGDDSLYTGITNDLARRAEKHNRGVASRYTRARLPCTIVYSEEHPSRSAASKREAALKKLTRAQKEALIAAPPVNP
ncbi:MAG: GIY-YIG nuclease family protein [Gemmataceae bacterium]